MNMVLFDSKTKNYHVHHADCMLNDHGLLTYSASYVSKNAHQVSIFVICRISAQSVSLSMT